MKVSDRLISLSTNLPANSTVAERLNGIVTGVVLAEDYVVEIMDDEFTLFLDNTDFVIEIDDSQSSVSI